MELITKETSEFLMLNTKQILHLHAVSFAKTDTCDVGNITEIIT